MQPGSRAHTSRAQNGRAQNGRPEKSPAQNGPLQNQPTAADSGPAAESQPARSSRYSIKNWRVRSRLLLLVAIPTLTALVFGGLNISSSVRSAQAYGRVLQLANLSGDVTQLVQALQDEREDTVTFIASVGNGDRAQAFAGNGGERALIGSDRAITRAAAAQVRSLAETIGSSYPGLAQQQAQAALAAIDDLPALQGLATTSRLPALTVIQDYGNTITQLLTLENEVAAGSNDASLADSVHALTLISTMKEEVSQQQAIVTSALQPSLVGSQKISSTALSTLNQDADEQQANLKAFDLAATGQQLQIYNTALSAAQVANAQGALLEASSLIQAGKTSASDTTVSVASEETGYVVSGLGSVERQLVNSVISRSDSLRNGAITSALLDGLVVALLLVIALVSTTTIGRSMVRPLRRLRAGALEVAGLRLPETVRRMSEADGEGVSLEVEPIDVDSTDEIGEVARAFDQVHREALRLAANEAALRGNVNAMFVNLSRRSQSLVERQIRLIDELEQGEQDAERLASLFQMDHLATRMRRNSENLLVLAGHEESRRWNQPLALVDVLRAALSEIEHYERVTLNVQPGIMVRGQAVSDVVHLTAELVENATSFSADDTPVSIGGHLLGSGGVLLEISDEGVGMSAEEMAHANWRLDNPPVVDVAVSRRMGLFVVARLATKHGIRVRLRPAASGGLIALVWLPDEAIMQESARSVSGLPGSDFTTPDIPRQAGADPSATGVWGDLGRSAAEQEVTAARTPRFAPLRAEADESAGLARRIPGAGPRPGSDGPATTGPQPAATGPQPAVTGPLPVFRTVPRPAAENPEDRPEPTATGPLPAVGAPEEPATGPAEPAGTERPAAAYQPFGTSPEQADSTTTGSFEIGVPSVLGAPASGAGTLADENTGFRFTLDGGSDGRESDGSRGNDVIVPSPEDLGEESRLPIFEAVESDWFRRGRPAVGRSGHEEKVSNGSNGNGWVSAADEGWRAAEVAQAPSSGGVTSAGLPKRVPRANLVPGTAAPEDGSASVPARSAAATRDRFASFQRGVRKGRAAATGDGAGGGGDGAVGREDETSG